MDDRVATFWKRSLDPPAMSSFSLCTSMILTWSPWPKMPSSAIFQVIGEALQAHTAGG